MKKLFCLILFLTACKTKQPEYDVVRKEAKKMYTPPGTVWLRDNLFIDKTEISNFNYLEFLYWLKRKDYLEYASMVPDTNSWNRADVGSADGLVSYYLFHPLYRDYPVVGISYKQAVAFCKWRSDRVNEQLYLKEKHLKWNADSNYKFTEKVRFRLPSKTEWEYAAAAGLNYCYYPMGYESLTDKNNLPVSNTLENYNLNIKEFRLCSDTINIYSPLTKVFAGKANKYGILNLLGNASELINDTVYKGANFFTPLYTIKREENPGEENYLLQAESYNYKIDYRFQKPEPWIGFRCVCEVIEK